MEVDTGLQNLLIGTVICLMLILGGGIPDQKTYAQQPVLTGLVKDSVSGNPLVRANVFLRRVDRGTTTDVSGRYLIRGLTTGRQYILVCSYVGYRTYRDTIAVGSSRKIEKNIVLQRRPLPLEQIVVDSRSSDGDIASGLVRLNARKIERLPATLTPDVFRGLQHVPGVKASSDYSSQLYIRGSTPGQTMVQLSGMPIYQSSHVLGLFSAFNPLAMTSVELHKGNYPVEYGGRLGSVVNVQTRGGKRKEFSGHARVGLLASAGMVEGPHGHGSWMVAYRRSNIQPVLTTLNKRDIEGIPESFDFYDVNGRMNVQISADNRLSLTFFRSTDDMHFPFSDNMVFDVHYGNTAGALEWTHLATDNMLGHLSASFSRYASDSDALLTRAPFSRRSNISDISLEGSVEYLPDSDYRLQSGFEGTYQRFRLRDRHGGATRLRRSLEPWHGAFYTEGRGDMSRAWTAEGGVRLTYHSTDRQVRMSPRFSLTYQPSSAIRLYAAAGRYYQHLTRTRSYMISSFDAWLPIGDHFSPSVSDHLSGELRWEPADAWSLTGGGYYRAMKNLFRLDPRLPDATGLPYRELFISGEGRAYGTELLLQKTSGQLTGQAAYTYGHTLRRFAALNGGRWYEPRHDRRHQLDLSAHASIGNSWGVSAAFTYASGQPHTEPTAQYILPDSPYMGHRHAVFISRLNKDRLPSYRRLDIGVTREGQLWGSLSYRLAVHVINVLSSNNVWFDLYQYNEEYEIERTHIPQIPVPLPALALEVKF